MSTCSDFFDKVETTQMLIIFAFCVATLCINASPTNGTARLWLGNATYVGEDVGVAAQDLTSDGKLITDNDTAIGDVQDVAFDSCSWSGL